MVRQSRDWASSAAGSPHVRGDGPDLDDLLEQIVGSPHVRGDGPALTAGSRRGCWFSPRAWGWSASITGLPGSATVLPTCVGMVRPPQPAGILSPSSPHVRGDGPLGGAGERYRTAFSPRAWGWSGCQIPRGRTDRVLPTCVGMVRQHIGAHGRSRGSPHVRGDGPPVVLSCARRFRFSPRAWGWSGNHRQHRCRGSVLPTCVGMVREDLMDRPTCKSSPHVRGDGPSLRPRDRPCR